MGKESVGPRKLEGWGGGEGVRVLGKKSKSNLQYVSAILLGIKLTTLSSLQDT